MTTRVKRDPRERILKAAISLFAQKGFAAAGVREIASAAEVNIAMISYYFEGKAGILKAIIGDFFDRYSRLLKDADDETKTPEECVRVMVGKIVDFVRKNTELALVTYNELPLDIPEIAEMKAERITGLIKKMSGLICRFGGDPKDTSQTTMIGPSLVSMIIMNFRLRSILRQVLKVKLDDTYYQRLKETLATLFLDGIHGMTAQEQKQKVRR